MPSRFVKLIGDHAEADRARAGGRDKSRLERRFQKLLQTISPANDPEMLAPVEGVDFLTKWEQAFAQMGSVILLDELCDHMIQELPQMDRQLRAELKLASEIGPEGLKRVPPISLKHIQKIIKQLEDEDGGIDNKTPEFT